MSDQPVHGTVAARWDPACGWRGVLITGMSGAGKSDLALRLIGQGWRLVADDYAHVFASGGVLYATAPRAIVGRMEARGVGVVTACTVAQARLSLAVELVEGAVERLPERRSRRFDGVDLPLIALDPREASVVEKVTAAIARL